jgi:4-hydroxyphenylacetate 3-monooxygenase
VIGIEPGDFIVPEQGRVDQVAIITLPSSFRNWTNPELAPILHRTQRSPNFTSEDKVKLLKAAWDAIGSEFGSRHTQYEMFYAGARFVATGYSYRTFDWGAACGMVDHLTSTYALDEVAKLARG